MPTFRIAIVGAGPAGYFAAQALQNLQNDHLHFAIDMFEKLPTPWGLVRSGVAPDHPKIKTVSKVFEKIASQDNFRLLANVNVGADVSIEELTHSYDAVVIAVGTPRGKRLGIPGEELRNVISSADFVFWYNGHPDYRDLAVDLSGNHAIVIGAGNVAMDVGRMLALDPVELDATDTADHALTALHNSSIRNVAIMARRGAENAAFTSPELRELPDLESTDVVIEKSQIEVAMKRAGSDPEKHVKSNLEAMLAISEAEPKDVDRKLRFNFEHKPVAIKGKDRVEAVLFETPEGEVEMACDLLVTAIGYEPVEIAGLKRSHNHYENSDGHMEANLYVVGWAKRGPSGVIGTNKSDAAEVMRKLVESLTVPKESADLVPTLESRGVRLVTQADWVVINNEEIVRGEASGKPRVKFTEVSEMLNVIKK